MKTRILSFVFLLIFSQGFAQQSDMKQQREELYKDYMNLKDTMTTRTWINMVNLSKKLEAVVLFDNVMLDSLAVTYPGQANLETRIAELTQIKDELISSNAKVNMDYTKTEQSRKKLLIASIISGIMLVILAVLLIVLNVKYRSLSIE